MANIPLLPEEQYRKDVEKALYQFGEKGLKASDEYIKTVKELGDKIFRKLKAKSRFSIAEVKIAGSIGKKTDVLLPDLDLLVVVNNHDPPYDKHNGILDDFEDILELNRKELQIKEHEMLKRTKFSIQFHLSCGIPVDILPVTSRDYKEIHEMLVEDPSLSALYSSSLSRRQMDFFTSHDSSFVHVVIRLAKFWFKSLCFGVTGFGGGGKLIIELISLAMAEKEEYDYATEKSVLRAFSNVLNTVCNIKTLKLAFRELIGREKWERVPQGEIHSPGLIPKVIGTHQIFKSTHFIIDPANPFNNLLAGKKPIVLDELISFAKITKQRLSSLVDGKFTVFNPTTGSAYIDLLKLFEPQPASLKTCFPKGSPKDFVVCYNVPHTSSFPDMKVRNEAPLKRREVFMTIETIKWRLETAIHSVVKNTGVTTIASSSSNNNASSGIKETVLKRIQEAVSNQTKQNFGVTNLVEEKEQKEDKMDVTLTLPYEVNGEQFAMSCSMSWI